MFYYKNLSVVQKTITLQNPGETFLFISINSYLNVTDTQNDSIEYSSETPNQLLQIFLPLAIIESINFDSEM